MTDFEKLVFAMREKQKEYFKTRDRVVLAESKRLEMQVDKYLQDKTINKLFWPWKNQKYTKLYCLASCLPLRYHSGFSWDYAWRSS